MKIFTKLYLGMMTLLVAALLASAFFMVKTTLDRNLQRETANGLDNHKIMVTAFRNNLLLFSGDSLSVSQNMDKIGRITQGSGSVPILIAMDDKVLYNDAGMEYRPDLAITNMINYRTVSIEGKTEGMFSIASVMKATEAEFDAYLEEFNPEIIEQKEEDGVITITDPAYTITYDRNKQILMMTLNPDAVAVG